MNLTSSLKRSGLALSLIVFPADAMEASTASHPAQSHEPSAEYAVAYQINPAHSGSVTFKQGFKTPLTQVWTANTPDQISAPYAVVANGRVFVTTRDTNGYGSQLYALDLSSGAQLWHQLLGTVYFWSAAAYDDGRLFVANQSGQLESLKEKTGKPLWFDQLAYGFSGGVSPSVRDGHVFISGEGYTGGTLYSVDEATGTLSWSQPVTNGNAGSPAVSKTGVFVSYPCQIYRFAAKTGSLRWNVNEEGDGGGGETSVYYRNRVYVYDPICRNVVLSAKDGTNLGTFSATEPPAFYSDGTGTSYGVAVNGSTLIEFSFETGATLWTSPAMGSLTLRQLSSTALSSLVPSLEISMASMARRERNCGRQISEARSLA